VTVNQNGGLIIVRTLFCGDDRMAGSFVKGDFIQPDLFKLMDQKISGFFYVIFVAGVRADTWNAKQFKQLFFMGFDILVDIRLRGAHNDDLVGNFALSKIEDCGVNII
jgi:hypothetical protein